MEATCMMAPSISWLPACSRFRRRNHPHGRYALHCRYSQGYRRTSMNAKLLQSLALFFAAFAAATLATAAAFPEKTVRIILPWPPGGSTDIVGRLLAAELTTR